MKIKSNYKIREVAGEKIVVIQGSLNIDLTRVVRMNKTSEWLWNSLEGKEFTCDTVSEMLQSNYNIDPVQANKDAGEWVLNMENAGLIDA